MIAPEWEDPAGVPISAFLFGGRRETVIPLVTEAFDWEHGTFLGSIMSSAKTAAAAGQVGEVRRDPMAMLPFCGYHMGDYFAHWLRLGAKTDPAKLPKIFYVNWFRRDADRRFIWPGFGDNSRVLGWVFERCAGVSEAIDSPIGRLPTVDALDVSGMDLAPNDLEELLRVDFDGWQQEIPLIEQHYEQFADRLPAALTEQLDALRSAAPGSSAGEDGDRLTSEGDGSRGMPLLPPAPIGARGSEPFDDTEEGRQAAPSAPQETRAPSSPTTENAGRAPEIPRTFAAVAPASVRTVARLARTALEQHKR